MHVYACISCIPDLYYICIYIYTCFQKKTQIIRFEGCTNLYIMHGSQYTSHDMIQATYAWVTQTLHGHGMQPFMGVDPYYNLPS